MKYSVLPVIAVLLLLSGCMATRSPVEQPQEPTPLSTELRGVWFSYYDWDALPKEQSAFTQAVREVITTVRTNGLNTIFLHVHSHSDSYYTKSTYFPLSKYVSGAIGVAPDYDPLEIFIQEAHTQGIQIHAWLNPYRVGSQTLWDQFPDDSIVQLWWNTPSLHRNVLFHKNQYYLNPSSQQVQTYLVSAIRELCQNYDIDGVQFDDYFYPQLNDNDPDLAFDKPDYLASGSPKTITQWRQDAVSSFIASVHAVVQEELPNGVFGVSPAGNLANLRSSTHYLIDIDTWLADSIYVDYILPQIYWGFEPRRANGDIAPWAFEQCLGQWQELMANSPVTLYVGLALYHAGTDVKDGNSPSEWIAHDDIIARQIERCQTDQTVDGFALFDYRDMLRSEAQPEMVNVRAQLGATVPYNVQ